MTDDETRAVAQDPPAGTDWFFLEAFEWMWRDDGLGLRPGAELMVYATIYRASCHGGGAFVATNASMGEVLGYPRETVSRAVNRLVREGLVWVVGHVRDGRGGKSVRCYAVSQGAIDRAQRRISARTLERGGGLATEVAPVENLVGPQLEGNVTKRHIGVAGKETFRQNVTERHAGMHRRDETSHPQCDETSHVTKRHIGENGTPPAQTSLFDSPHISTNHLSTDQGDEGDVENRLPVPSAPGADGAVALSPNDEAAFAELLAASLRPVDAGFVEDNRREFARLLAEGIGAEVVLTAYREYADYQRRLLADTGKLRPMHLLNWLRQSPNSNIQYVLRRTGKGAGDHRRADGAADKEPQLKRCWDGCRHYWIAIDERGPRIVEGSERAERPEVARALYEAMRQRECAM